MKTYLLTWNPNKISWSEYARTIERINQFGVGVEFQWSCGRTKKMSAGDRFFLMRLGEEPEGLIASGKVVKEAYEDLHWDIGKAMEGKLALFVDVRVDTIVSSEGEVIVPIKELQKAAFNKKNWTPRMSGTEIPPRIAEKLESLWAEKKGALYFHFPEEVDMSMEFTERAVRKISVNRFERDPKARRECIEAHGAACTVCGFDFGKKYGSIGKGYIHVHHTKPLADVDSGYLLDPVKDLVPVCPNCHAMLHRKKPAMSIRAAKNLLKK